MCYDPFTNTDHVSFDVSFCESKPYYSWRFTESSFQGERGCEGNLSSPSSIIEFEEIENLEERFNIPVHVSVNEPRPVESDTKATEATEPCSQQVEGPSRTIKPHTEATKLTSLSVDKSTRSVREETGATIPIIRLVDQASIKDYIKETIADPWPSSPHHQLKSPLKMSYQR